MTNSLSKRTFTEKGEQETYQETFDNCPVFRKLFIKMLEKKKEEKANAILLSSNYENPNWTLDHADKIGQIRAINEIIGYLSK